MSQEKCTFLIAITIQHYSFVTVLPNNYRHLAFAWNGRNFSAMSSIHVYWHTYVGARRSKKTENIQVNLMPFLKRVFDTSVTRRNKYHFLEHRDKTSQDV